MRAVSSTAVNLYWNILRHDKYIGGYFIKFRVAGTATATGHGNFSLVTVRRGLAQTHTLLNLRKYAKYEFILVPFYKDIKGTSSNVMSCQTLEDGESLYTNEWIQLLYMYARGPILVVQYTFLHNRRLEKSEAREVSPGDMSRQNFTKNEKV